jgi:hypothetical protein
MEKLAQPGEGGGDPRTPTFTISTITYKVVMYAPAEKEGTLLFFLLYPYMYSVILSPSCALCLAVSIYYKKLVHTFSLIRTAGPSLDLDLTQRIFHCPLLNKFCPNWGFELISSWSGVSCSNQKAS